MDELPLPADIERWPRDPFALLGVKMGSDVKSVKRAYQKLIRVYRPEHYPVEFRRIREAYESAQSMTGWFSTIDPAMVDEIVLRGADEAPQPYDDLPRIPLAPDVPLPTTDEAPPVPIATPPDVSPPEVAAEETAAPEPLQTEPATIVPPVAEAPVALPPLTATSARPDVDEYGEQPYEQCLAEAWRPVSAGDVGAAYRELSTLCRARSGRSEAYLALYWLLRLTPKLEVERKPCDWLTDCMSNCDESGQALELYRRELVRRPTEATTPRCTGLVRAANPREIVVALVEWRWRAVLAAQRDAAAIVREDLDSLRKTRLSYDTNAWMRVLWSVVETCCWTRSPDAQRLTTDAMRELERFANAPDANHDALSQLDYMTEAAAGLNVAAAGEAAQVFRRLIARSWSLSASDLYVLLSRFVEPFLPQPADLLRFLADVGDRGNIVLGRFGQVLQMVQHELQRSDETFWTPTSAESAILDFLIANNVKLRYDHEFRAMLLLFCLYERISPELMAEAINSGYEFKESDRWLPERLMQDWPLRFTYQTIHLLTA